MARAGLDDRRRPRGTAMATAPVPEQGCQHEVPQVQEHVAEVAGGQGDATGAVAQPRC